MVIESIQNTSMQELRGMDGNVKFLINFTTTYDLQIANFSNKSSHDACTDRPQQGADIFRPEHKHNEIKKFSVLTKS